MDLIGVINLASIVNVLSVLALLFAVISMLAIVLGYKTGNVLLGMLSLTVVLHSIFNIVRVRNEYRNSFGSARISRLAGPTAGNGGVLSFTEPTSDGDE